MAVYVWIFWILVGVVCLNFLLLLSMVFLERRKLQNIIAWQTVMTFLPIVGFFIYVVFGSGLSARVRRMIRKKSLSERDILVNIKGIQKLSDAKIDGFSAEDEGVATYCYNLGAYPCTGNSVKIYNFGLDKIEALKKDLLKAKHSIHIEYYIFANDVVGKEILEILCAKAREGVKVKLIYDSIGSRHTPRKFFKQLEKAGGEVAEFFPPLLHFRSLNLKLNYRNHRKIVVIDGLIGYTGGLNIRDDHMGRDRRLSPWRDTHIRMVGSGVYGLQNIFLDDWRYCKNDDRSVDFYLENGYFPSPKLAGDVTVQTLSSGPDTPEQKLKETFIKLISSAKKRIYIQTPYFIPDDTFLSALRIALKSGVDVRIMCPYVPDKKTVYLVTLSYLKEMSELGAKIYLYQGFIHAKTLLIDDNKLSIGTCNMDNRSFGLNFEDTVLMYSNKLNENYANQFHTDENSSYEVGVAYFKKKRWLTKFLSAIFRLLAPLF